MITIGTDMERSISQIINEIASFPSSKKEAIIISLNRMLQSGVKDRATVLEVRKNIQQKSPINCPHCKSETIVGYGRYRDRKRYKCKSCGKTFNDLSGTSISKIHKKSEWKDYISCMADGLSLRASAARTGVSLKTSFLWRHKILGSFQGIGCTKLEGIVESDETFFLFSEKGDKAIEGREPRKRGGKASKAGISDDHVAVIVASDRNKHSIIEVAGRSRITAEKIDDAIGKWTLGSAVALCSDSHRSYEKFAKMCGLRHIAINASKGQYVKDKVYHIQNVNSAHSLLKKWIMRFNGVATKYLQNYMNWFRIERENMADETIYLKLALTSNTSYVACSDIRTQYIIT